MIADGIVVFAGFAFLAGKLPRKTMLRILGRPLVADVGVTATAYSLHWGSFDGVMAAAVAGMLSSATISMLRHGIGYITPEGEYIPGHWRQYNLEELAE
jgi:hypothetical protein